MRYYLGNCDFKWKHTSEHGNPKMEYIWVRRQLGEKLAKEIEQNNYELELVKTEGVVPDLFCKCHIFVHIKNKYEALLFNLKNSKAILVEEQNNDVGRLLNRSSGRQFQSRWRMAWRSYGLVKIWRKIWG